MTDLTDSSSFDKAKYWVGQLKSAEPVSSKLKKTRLYLQDLFTLGITSNSWHYSCVALWNICYGSILSLVQILSFFISNALSYY